MKTSDVALIATARCDDDPAAGYRRAEVLLLIEEADHAIKALKRTTTSERRAFAVLVLLKNRQR